VSSHSRGAPDYETLIWRGATNPRIRLRENEALGSVALFLTPLPSIVPYRKDPLASLASTNGIDVFTGNEFVGVPVGYTYFTLGFGFTFDQPCRIRGISDGIPNINAFLGSFTGNWLEGARPWYDATDPFGAVAHAHVYTFTNLGSLDMSGHYNAPYIIKSVGSKPITHKTVRCRVCGAQRRVNRRATRVKCKKCKATTMYRPMLFGEKEKPILEEIE